MFIPINFLSIYFLLHLLLILFLICLYSNKVPILKVFVPKYERLPKYFSIFISTYSIILCLEIDSTRNTDIISHNMIM